MRPNVGIELAYQRRLEALIEEMHRSLRRWLLAAYRANEPEVTTALAADASPSSTLKSAMRRLARRWQRRFNEAARGLAEYFAQQAAQRSDAALRSILNRGGLSVRFRRTRAVNDVLQATVTENVSLIRSIAQQHLTQVEGLVMRSVQTGRDLGSLSEALEHQFHVTKRRAAFIARDQNNKTTAIVQRVRQAEIGVQDAIWVHSGGGRHPRPSHLKAGKDRVRYTIKDGWFDPDEGLHILPGQLMNCRCVARPVIPGFS